MLSNTFTRFKYFILRFYVFIYFQPQMKFHNSLQCPQLQSALVSLEERAGDRDASRWVGSPTELIWRQVYRTWKGLVLLCPPRGSNPFIIRHKSWTGEKMKKGSSYPDWFQESDWVKVKPRVPHFSGLMSSKLKLWIMLEVSSEPPG